MTCSLRSEHMTYKMAKHMILSSYRTNMFMSEASSAKSLGVDQSFYTSFCNCMHVSMLDSVHRWDVNFNLIFNFKALPYKIKGRDATTVYMYTNYCGPWRGKIIIKINKPKKKTKKKHTNNKASYMYNNFQNISSPRQKPLFEGQFLMPCDSYSVHEISNWLFQTKQS